MKNRFNYFLVASRLFWILFGFFIILGIFQFGTVFFNAENLAERIVEKEKLADIEEEILPPVTDDSVKYRNFVWKWHSAKSDRQFEMTFSIPENGISESILNHTNASDFPSISDCYHLLFSHDKIVLDSMIYAYQALAQKEGLDYMERMEMVVSSIQEIPYTWVLDQEPSCGEYIASERGREKIPRDNCSESVEPSGCCDGVKWGVYSPVEFVVKRTGDCDTRSLLAYTILRKMGYDVAIMVSQSQWHSVLGVNIPSIPGDGRTGNIGAARNYYLWELTVFGPPLGMEIDGTDWSVAYK